MEVTMPAPRELEALVAAARLYYLENLSQAEVAQRLGTSRSNISRMLASAVEQGVVEIRVNDPAGRDRELEEALRTRFGLRSVRVAQRTAVGDADQQVGAQAGRFLLSELRDGMTVALSWGSALQSMVWHTTAEHDYAVKLVQLVGGLSAVENEVSGHELVRELASRLGASYRYLHAPATLTTAAARDALAEEASVEQALAEARRADIAFVGIGTPNHGSSAAVLTALALDAEEAAQLRKAEPVGDIAARYFDADGKPVLGPVHERVLAVTLSDLAAIPTVVGVACGRVKAAGVLGALRGRLIDVLVCDESLARAVLTSAGATTQPENTDESEARR
jgi:DNA-binding transcriptional regulator LsrR (DeoR family)